MLQHHKLRPLRCSVWNCLLKHLWQLHDRNCKLDFGQILQIVLLGRRCGSTILRNGQLSKVQSDQIELEAVLSWTRLCSLDC